MIQTYNEFKVTYVKGKVSEKKQTKRGTVRISEQTANTNNIYSNSTGLLYELSDEQPEEKKKIGRPPKTETK